MSSRLYLPLVPFDPTEVGPRDLGREGWSRTKRFVDENLPWLLGAGVALILGAWYFGIEPPKVPDWMLVGIGAGVVASLAAVPTGIYVAAGIYQEDNELLSVQNPKNGNQKLVHVSPERFENMRVKNQNDEWRDLDFLHTVRINGRRAYEVDHYNVERNVATASWQAGATNSEMRREKGRIGEIKTELEREADKAHELMANFTSIVRGQVGDVAEELVMVAEDVDLPTERAGLHERLGESLRQSDPSDDLVTGFEEQTRDPEDVEPDEQDAAEADVDGLNVDEASAIGAAVSQVADIHERARQMEQSRTNGHSDDSGGSNDE